jgi:hypothetical protein
MENVSEIVERAKQSSASLYPRHVALINAIRIRRGVNTGEIPGISDVVQEAIADLARRELDPAQFADLMVGAA